MKTKVLNALLILTPLLGLLEWGGGNRMFLWRAEAEIIAKLFTDPLSVIHPLTLLPLFGQVILLITLFQKQPSKRLTLIGMSAIAVLLLLMFLIGILDTNYKILLSTLPFIITGVLTVVNIRNQAKA